MIGPLRETASAPSLFALAGGAGPRRPTCWPPRPPVGCQVASAGKPGSILSESLSKHGFGIDPGAGHLIAGLDTGAEPIFERAPFRPGRFNKSAWGKVADF